MDNYHWGKDRIWLTTEIEKAKELRAAGWTATEIAAQLGRSRNSVIGKLYRAGAGVPQSNRFWNPNRVYRLRRLYFGANGFSQDELAKQLGCSKATLQKGIRLIRGAPLMSRKLTASMPKRTVAKPTESAPECATVSAALHPNGEPRGPKQLWELNYGECKWPFGDHDYTFCAKLALKDQPYCAEHSMRARGRP